MTPKENAAQLLGKFEKSMLSISLHQSANKEVAKKCALIAIEEMLKLSTWVDETVFNYIKDIQNEIEKS